MVTAGFKCAPLIGDEAITPTNTARAQPIVMTIQPELFPFVPLRSTLATTPSPSKTSNAVPINSPKNGFMIISCGDRQPFTCTDAIWPEPILAQTNGIAFALQAAGAFLNGVEIAHGRDVKRAVGRDGCGGDRVLQFHDAENFFLPARFQNNEIAAPAANKNFSISDECRRPKLAFSLVLPDCFAGFCVDAMQ